MTPNLKLFTAGIVCFVLAHFLQKYGVKFLDYCEGLWYRYKAYRLDKRVNGARKK